MSPILSIVDFDCFDFGTVSAELDPLTRFLEFVYLGR